MGFATQSGVIAESDPNAILKALADAKGDVFAATADNTVARVAVGTDGQVLTADAASTPGVKWAAVTAGFTILKKTADETVNNSTAVQDDDVLSFAVVATGMYYFEVHFVVNPVGASGFKFDFTGPASSSMIVTEFATGLPISVGGGNAFNSIGTAHGQGGLTVGANNILSYRGLIITAGTAGTIQLRWAQNALIASNTVLKAGSCIIYSRTDA